MRRFLRATDLDATTLPGFRERLMVHQHAEEIVPRRYPGYPRVELPATAGQLQVSPASRRTVRRLTEEQPVASILASLLVTSHGVTAEHGRGPVPSAGGLQALELYMVAISDGWLPRGVYHYDRAGGWLSQLRPQADRLRWRELIPSSADVTGGSLAFVLVGDGERVTEKYGERGLRFLLLEAGHLMQNLCLVAGALGMGIVPCGGFLEARIAAELSLPPKDEVLYAAVGGLAPG